MDLSALQQQILSSNKSASEKAERFLLESTVNELSRDEWRQLIAGIPEEVKKAIGTLKSAGTYLDLDTGQKVPVSSWVVMTYTSKVACLELA